MTTELAGSSVLIRKYIMSANLNEVFGRINNDGNVDILYINDGDRVTRLNADGIYPVNSLLSTKYEHAYGIILLMDQCKTLNIAIE